VSEHSNLNDGPRCPKHQDVTMRFVSGAEPHHDIKVPHWRCELWIGGGVCGATRPAGTTAPKAAPLGIEDVRELLQAARESVGESDGGSELIDTLELCASIVAAKDAIISSQERNLSEFRWEAMSRHTFENKPGEPGPCIHCGAGIATHTQSNACPLLFWCPAHTAHVARLEAENRRLVAAIEEAMRKPGFSGIMMTLNAALTPAPASSGEQAVVPKGATTDLADMSDETRGKLLAIILPRQEPTRDPIIGPGGWINCSYCGSLMNPARYDDPLTAPASKAGAGGGE